MIFKKTAKKEYIFEQEINKIENASKEIHLEFETYKTLNSINGERKSVLIIINLHNIIEILADYLSIWLLA